MQKAMNNFLPIEFGKIWRVKNFIILYQKKCVTSLITLILIIFDSSVDGIVCILQTASNKFCQIIKVSCLHDNYKHEPWLTNKIKSVIKGKKQTA